MVQKESNVSLKDGNFLFRFRSAKALLADEEDGGFKELEKQTIYFSRAEELNDPVEGLYDAFWKGDEVLWENLLKHYALSLVWYAYNWLLVDPEEIDDAIVIASLTEDSLPSDQFKQLYQEFCSDFLEEIKSKDLAKRLGKHKLVLRREQLTNLLFTVHQCALSHLFRLFKEKGFVETIIPTPKFYEEHLQKVLDFWEEENPRSDNVDMELEEHFELFSSVMNHTTRQLDLVSLAQMQDRGKANKVQALMSKFPEMYVDAFLRDLHFTPARVACFSRNCTNASMWGTYGSEHRGAALIFRTQETKGRRFLHVKGLTGTGYDGMQLEVHKVSYRERPPVLDSFLHIGRLPRKQLESAWMKSEMGRPSRRLQEINEDIGGWRANYWESALNRYTWKHPDWQHEDEQRLIALTPFQDDPAPEPLTYDFSQLEGIIFGMRMTNEDKLRIMQAIERKCRKERRSDFRFFQASYSPVKGSMVVSELRLLKFDFKAND